MTRGYVQHVGTQEGTYFVTLDKMSKFMMEHLSPSEDMWIPRQASIDFSTVALNLETRDE